MDNLSEVLKNFSAQKVMVVGDAMLDKTIVGDVSRISPEAPVPIISVQDEIYELGGAANVAANISSLGGDACLFGFTGKDESAEIFLSLLKEKGIKSFLDTNARTILKVRAIGRNQQLLRLDYEDTSPKEFSQKTLQAMQTEMTDSEIILISDYAKGAVTSNLMKFLKSFGKRIIIDPKPKNIHLYSGSYLIAPNEKEALEMSGQKDFQDAGRFLKEKLDCNVLITRGEKGVALFSHKDMNIPTYAQEVYDIVGAGDTSIAALSLSLASGASLEEATIISNHAAGIAVSKAGTSHVRLGELEKKIFGEEEKVKNFEDLSRVIDDLRRKGKKIAWTNGCFDILHLAHVRYLKKTREQGDYLIVGLNSDSSARRLKGLGRPINNEQDRAEVLSEHVDYIIIFSEPDTTRYLSAFRPDVYVKGGDYAVNTINQDERKIVESYGGRIEIINVESDVSTTRIIEKIKNSKNGF